MTPCLHAMRSPRSPSDVGRDGETIHSLGKNHQWQNATVNTYVYAGRQGVMLTLATPVSAASASASARCAPIARISLYVTIGVKCKAEWGQATGKMVNVANTSARRHGYGYR
jgi:hypothetical protein